MDQQFVSKPRRGAAWYLQHYNAYRKDFGAMKEAKLWLFLVPPCDTYHFSVIAAVNPTLCNPSNTVTSTDKPCFIGMDSFRNAHGKLHIHLINTYLRR